MSQLTWCQVIAIIYYANNVKQNASVHLIWLDTLLHSWLLHSVVFPYGVPYGLICFCLCWHNSIATQFCADLLPACPCQSPIWPHLRGAQLEWHLFHFSTVKSAWKLSKLCTSQLSARHTHQKLVHFAHKGVHMVCIYHIGVNGH